MKRFSEAIQLTLLGVEVAGRPRGRSDSKTLQQRQRGELPGSDRNAPGVRELQNLGG